jgi:hypothetical protein
MIKKNDIKIIGILNDKYRLSKIYRSGYLVYGDEGGGDTSSSCFGSGHWINSLPWINSDAWKNN